MLEVTGLSLTWTIAIILAVSAVASYGLTEVLRRGYLAYKKTYDMDGLWWWAPSLRLLAMLIGTGVGVLLMYSWLGAGIGLIGGTLNTTVVAIVKKRLKGAVEVI